MKRVLVVDDEEDMLWMLQRNLNKGMPDVEILAASSGEEALSVLSDKSANLVITDINMPGMNGLDLLIEINNRYPQTGVIIMTAYPSSAYENEAMMSGSLRFVEKPFDINEMRSIVEQHLKDDEGFQGTIDGIELMDIVQFNGLSRATAALKVTTAEEEGMIFFKDGEVVHAMCDQLSGEEAFFKVISFHGGSLQNIKGVEPPIMSIQKGLESLLFEAALQSDHDGEETDSDDDDGADNPATALSEDIADSDEEHATLEDLDLDSDLLNEDLDDAAPEDETDLTDAISEVEEAIIEDPVELDEIVTEAPVEDNVQIEEKTENNTSAEDSAETTTIGDEEMTDIQKILAEFTNIEGVHTACLVGRDGFLLDSLARQGIDAEMIGAIASSGFGSAESMGTQLGQGDLNMTMLEYQNGPVMFAPVGTEAFLVIVADQETNLGWIRLAIKKNSKKIQEIAQL